MQVFRNIDIGGFFENRDLSALWREGLAAFLDMLAMQKDQIFLWLPVFMGVGVGAYFSLAHEPSLAFVIAGVGGVFLLGVLAWKYPQVRIPTIFIICALLGFSVSKIRTDHVYTPILTKKLQPVSMRGDVAKILKSEDGVRLELVNLSIERLGAGETPKRVRVKFREDQGFQIGQEVQLLAGLSPPSPPLLPGGFDFQRYMYFHGIGAIGFAYGAAEIVGQGSSSGFQNRIQIIRDQIAQSLIERLDMKLGAVASALLVGQRQMIAEDDIDAMRESGLAHMLAISGLHVGLFFGIVFFAARLSMAFIPAAALKYPIKKYAAFLAMVTAVLYMFMAGGTIPTQRAVLMIAVVFVAILMDRTPFSLRLVAFAALAVLLFFPENLLSVSFQMSFAAVTALIVFYEWLRPFWSALHQKAGLVKRASLYFLGISMTTIVATFATAPFAFIHFQQIALYSLLANIVAMPILAFVVMPFAVLYFILLPFGLDGLAAVPMGWGINGILDIAHFVSNLEGAVFRVSQWSSKILVLFTLMMLCVVLIKGRLKYIAILPAILIILMFSQQRQPDILISSDVDVVAYIDGNKHVSFPSVRRNRFTRENWLQAFGQEEDEYAVWPKEGAFNEELTCGEAGCRIEKSGQKIEFLKDVQGFEEACGWATLIISRTPLPECEGVRVIDRFDTIDAGIHAVYINDGSITVNDTESARGTRPWVASAQASLGDR